MTLPHPSIQSHLTPPIPIPTLPPPTNDFFFSLPPLRLSTSRPLLWDHTDADEVMREFWDACAKGDKATVKATAPSLEDLDEVDVDGDGYSGLHYAVKGKHKSVAAYLLGLGANADTYSAFGGDTALHLACKLSNAPMVRLLLEGGADPSLPSTKTGLAPLEMARTPELTAILQRALGMPVPSAILVRAAYSFAAEHAEEMSLAEGDTVVVDYWHDGNEWQFGNKTLPATHDLDAAVLSGHKGLFPAAFVKTVPQDSPAQEAVEESPSKTPNTPGTPVPPAAASAAAQDIMSPETRQLLEKQKEQREKVKAQLAAAKDFDLPQDLQAKLDADDERSLSSWSDDDDAPPSSSPAAPAATASSPTAAAPHVDPAPVQTDWVAAFEETTGPLIDSFALITQALSSVKLDKYLANFQDAGVDDSLLAELNLGDLKEMGISRLGDRKKVLMALRAAGALDDEDDAGDDEDGVVLPNIQVHGVAPTFPGADDEEDEEIVDDTWTRDGGRVKAKQKRKRKSKPAPPPAVVVQGDGEEDSGSDSPPPPPPKRVSSLAFVDFDYKAAAAAEKRGSSPLARGGKRSRTGGANSLRSAAAANRASRYGAPPGDDGDLAPPPPPPKRVSSLAYSNFVFDPKNPPPSDASSAPAKTRSRAREDADYSDLSGDGAGPDNDDDESVVVDDAPSQQNPPPANGGGGGGGCCVVM